jgi:hypothetical protein
MMTNIQRLKGTEIQNGQLVNANDINAELDQVVNKANELDDAVYQNKTFTGNKIFNGSTVFQQASTFNAGITLQNAPVVQSQLIHWGGTENNASSSVFEVNPPYAPVPLPDGYTVAFRVQDTPSNQATLNVKVGANASMPLVKDDGQRIRGLEVVNGETLVVIKSGTQFVRVGASQLPTAYMQLPIPEYVDGTTVRVYGWCAIRLANNQEDIEFLQTANISTATVGLNGLETGTVASNTWYTLKALRSLDGTSAGFVLGTASSNNDVTLGATVYKARRLPLTVRTDANGAILPFVVAGGWPYQPDIRYTTVKTGAYTTKLATEADTRILIAGTPNPTDPVTVACGAYVPTVSRIAHLCFQGVGGGGAQLYVLSAHDDNANTGYSLWNDPSNAVDRHYLSVALDGSRNIRYKATGGSWTVSVMGYTITTV